MTHLSVLLQEAIDGLDFKSGDIFVDGTLGGGGHSLEVYNRFGNSVVMIGIDLDPDAISRATSRLSSKECNFKTIQGSFRNIDELVSSLGYKKVDKILLDIGLSSNQFEDSGRGFSFQKDEPLIMSFGSTSSTGSPQGSSPLVTKFTARDIVNDWDRENIQAILEGYGEEQFAWKISNAIVARRNIKPIETTFELVDIVKSATPKFYHHRKIHPATKTFQALRITVNDEIESLKDGVRKGFEILNPKGRLAVISFHSLEDRIVKQFFKSLNTHGVAKIVNKKPVIPTKEEITENPRSRSAKLRIIEKI